MEEPPREEPPQEDGGASSSTSQFGPEPRWLGKAKERKAVNHKELLQKVKEMHDELFVQLGGMTSELSDYEDSEGDEEDREAILARARVGDIEELTRRFQEVQRNPLYFNSGPPVDGYEVERALANARQPGAAVPQEDPEPPTAPPSIEFDPEGRWSMLSVDARTQEGQEYIREFLSRQKGGPVPAKAEIFADAIEHVASS